MAANTQLDDRQEPTSGNYVGASYTTTDGVSSSVASLPPEARIDWFRCTLPDTPGNRKSLSLLLGPSLPREGGWRGWYDVSVSVLETGVIASCTDEARAAKQGLLVDLPAGALARLGDQASHVMRWCMRRDHCHVSRVDVCMDDHRGNVTMDRVKEAHDADLVVTRWQETTMLERRAKHEVSRTFYAGKRESECMLRIYDKRLEQHLPPESGPWVRVELECKGDLAGAILADYLDHGSVVVVQQLNRRLRFVIVSETDSNRRRWQPADWWRAFLSDMTPGLPLTHGSVKLPTVQAMARWFVRQASGTLAAITEAYGGDLTVLESFLDIGRERLKSKHKAAIAAFQEDAAARPEVLTSWWSPTVAPVA